MQVSSPVSVAIPCLNEVNTIGYALQGIMNQTQRPRRVWVADGGSDDGTLELLERWKNRLPLEIIKNKDQRQGPGLNRCLDRAEAPFLARLDAHSYWGPDYLETLVNDLKGNSSLAAVGGRVSLASDPTAFQQDAWAVMKHPLGTGAPAYRGGTEPAVVDSVQAPVYRTEDLKAVNGFPENLPWAEDEFLHHQLRRNGRKLKLNPSVYLYYFPRKSTLSFLRQFHHYGKGRGQLTARNIFPTERHETIDSTLKLWTFGLCWNPIGWGLFVFYLMTDVVLTIEQVRTKKSSPRFFYLLPIAHISYWLGWLSKRFSNDRS
jgi:glycosyltransferase involved in cell wall biosynthesis